MALHSEKDTEILEVWRIFSDVAEAEVFSIGGALHNLEFQLNGGRIKPLAEAPWQPDFLAGATSDHPRHIELLGGEWPCVPFGTTANDPEHHGFGTNNSWTLVAMSDNQICLSIEYPSGHVIERIERKITLPKGQTSVDFELTIHPRSSTKMPIGLHPIFRLPETLDKFRLVPAAYDCAMVVPKEGTPQNSVLKPGAFFQSLDSAELIDGQAVNILANMEVLRNELIQLWQVEGAFEIQDEVQGIRIRLDWDRVAFPHCLLWVSNPGMAIQSGGDPFRGIGIEPINSFFDMNDIANPDSEPAGVQLTAGQPWTTNYRITCENTRIDAN